MHCETEFIQKVYFHLSFKREHAKISFLKDMTLTLTLLFTITSKNICNTPVYVMFFPLCFKQTPTGLSVDQVPEEGVHQLLSHLDQVSTCLDLHAISIINSSLDLTHMTLRSKVMVVMRKYHDLKRIDLTGSQLSSELEQLLECLHSPLEYLNLSYCCVQQNDLDSLCRSQHCSSLRDLDLSYIYSSECTECSSKRSPKIQDDDRDGADSGFYGNSSPGDPSYRVTSPTTQERMTAQTEDLNIWTFWKFLSENSDTSAPPADSMHEQDRLLVSQLLTKLHCFPNMVVLEISNNCFSFRLPHDTLRDLLHGMSSMLGLKHLAI